VLAGAALALPWADVHRDDGTKTLEIETHPLHPVRLSRVTTVE
jgi:hypothetical protein